MTLLFDETVLLSPEISGEQSAFSYDRV